MHGHLRDRDRLGCSPARIRDILEACHHRRIELSIFAKTFSPSFEAHCVNASPEKQKALAVRT